MNDASPEPRKLRGALAAARAKVKARVFKAGTNREQGYQYVSHEAVVEHVREALVEQRVLVLPKSLTHKGELRWAGKSGDRVCWLWEQTFVLTHADSDEAFELAVQVTTIANDKAAFVASTAADRTLLMRIMGLAGSLEEDPEHGEEPEQRSAPARTQGAGPSPESARVVRDLIAELGKTAGDRESLAHFYETARTELALCRASEQQKTTVQQAFGERCAAAGLKPRDVVTGARS